MAVVEGTGQGHAYVTVPDDGGTRQVTLASRLNDGAMVGMHRLLGFDKAVFDVWAKLRAKWAKEFFSREEKLLCVDVAKVHLSALGLNALQKAKVTVIAETSKTSHLLQARDTPSLFGRIQPAVRRAIRTWGDLCVDKGRRFTILDLVDYVRLAAMEAVSQRNLASAFQRVGLWPWDPSRVPQEMLNKEADRPAADVDLSHLVAHLVTAIRKDMATPIVTNVTLSTAGGAVVRTAPEVLEAFKGLDEEKEASAEAKEAGKRAKEQRTSHKSTEKAAREAAAKRRERVLVWRRVCQQTAEAAQARMAACLPTLCKQGRRLQDARQRRLLGVE